MKVTVVVTAEGSGAEVIPFLKVWAVLPAAVLLTYFYTRLLNRFNREQVFYMMILFFLGFFTLFLLVLHPHQKSLELTGFADFLLSHLPEKLTGLKGLISLIRHWPLSLFYVISEMWSAIVLSMLFWGFANEITSVDEAKRFYAIFAIGANFSGIFSGQSAQWLKVQEYNPNIPFGTVAWEQTLALQLGVVLFLGIVIMLLFRWVNCSSWMQRNKPSLSFEPLSQQAHTLSAEKEADKRLSLRECFSYLLRSPYMVYIAVLVVAYNIVYNLSDVLWTHQISQRYPDPNKFNSYINDIACITGIFATLSGLILSGNVIRRFGWTVTALITPIIWLVTSIGFFFCMLFEANPVVADTLYAFTHIPLISLTLFFGSTQICLGRAAKYTVFDETKEIAFIPLPKSEQRKGKAVVDGIASRFGKSGGSLTIQVLLVLCHELVATIPYIAGIFVVCISFWLISVQRLGVLVSKAVDSADPLSRDTIQKQETGQAFPSEEPAPLVSGPSTAFTR